MKQVYIAKYKHGLKGPTKVVADDVESAKKAAFASFTYTSAPANPNPPIDDVVESVELDPDQVVSGWGVQPVVQTGTESLKSKDILKKIQADQTEQEGA